MTQLIVHTGNHCVKHMLCHVHLFNRFNCKNVGISFATGQEKRALIRIFLVMPEVLFSFQDEVLTMCIF